MATSVCYFWLRVRDSPCPWDGKECLTLAKSLRSSFPIDYERYDAIVQWISKFCPTHEFWARGDASSSRRERGRAGGRRWNGSSRLHSSRVA